MHNADELVPEGHPDPGVRHHPVVEVQVGTADRRQADLHDGIVGMLDLGDVPLFDPDLVRPAVNHRSHHVSSYAHHAPSRLLYGVSTLLARSFTTTTYPRTRLLHVMRSTMRQSAPPNRQLADEPFGHV